MNELDIKIEDLKGNLAGVVDVIGISATVALIKHYPGQYIYIPSGNSLIIERRNYDMYLRFINKKTTYAALVMETGLSDRHVRRIIAEEKKRHGKESL